MTLSTKEGLTYEECAQAAANFGIDLKCGACASIFYTGGTAVLHTCTRHARRRRAPFLGVVSLKALQEEREKMTPGEWRTAAGDAVVEVAGLHILDRLEEAALGDIPGIIATHNAADALIAVVYCLLKQKAADKVLHDASVVGEHDPQYPDKFRAGVAEDALNAALAKVTL